MNERAAKAWLKSVAKQEEEEGKAKENAGEPSLHGKVLLRELPGEQQWGTNL